MDDTAHRPWFEAQRLRPLHEVNERCMDMLVQMAAQRHTDGAPFALVHQIRNELRTLDLAARRHAAQCPFLLVDFDFRNPEWWREAKRHAVRSATGAQQRTLPRKSVLPLARATLVLAWHTVRTDPEAARIALGLPSAVAEAITALSLDEVERLAERHFHRVRPRWHDRATTWRVLLRAARDGDAGAIRDFRLHGIQLLGSELIPFLAA